ncbi:hypothetical protein ZHAS_00007159 [Anopheles sinensis]|uniref:Uncharacterized protein n=1 Tax=Anopheles sinensis TaxID=74873 RepID=A0A084VP99_ANOSI|nr:hypothetical protein ZHAS_00007159 [Anopheles sinensis]
MSISPMSPINDPDLYIEHRNQLNKLGSSCEAMDETDLSSPFIPSGPATLNKVFCCANDSTSSSKPGPVVGNSRGTFLGRPGSAVQIITTAAPSSTPPLLTSPDGNAKLTHSITLDDVDGSNTVVKKVGVCTTEKKSPRRVSIEQTATKPSTNAKSSTNNDNTSTTTKRTTTSNASTANHAVKHDRSSPSAAIKTITSTASNLGATLSTSTAHTAASTAASTGRISPSRSYDDMIKFVFTEHGIKVISDREYVV